MAGDRVPARGDWRDEGGRADEDGERRRDAQGVRQLRAVQGAPQRRTLAELRIAEHRRHGDPARADLPQQRERQLPLRLPADTRRNAGARALRRASATTRAGTRPRPASTPGPPSTTRPSPRSGSWRSCRARRSTAARRRPSAAPASGKLVPSRMRMPVRSGIVARRCRQTALGRPRRIGDEMLEGLIRARIAHALQHRAHRFAAAVAEQPEQIPAKRAALRDVREAHLERLEPLAQAIEPRRRTPRQSRQHRAAAYRTRRATGTSPLSRFCQIPE